MPEKESGGHIFRMSTDVFLFIMMNKHQVEAEDINDHDF